MFLRLLGSFQYVAKAENLLNSKPAAHSFSYTTFRASRETNLALSLLWRPLLKALPSLAVLSCLPSRCFAIVCIASWHSPYILFTYPLPALCFAHFCFPRIFNNALCGEGAEKELLNECMYKSLISNDSLSDVKNSFCVSYWGFSRENLLCTFHPFSKTLKDKPHHYEHNMTFFHSISK